MGKLENYNNNQDVCNKNSVHMNTFCDLVRSYKRATLTFGEKCQTWFVFIKKKIFA